MIKCITINVIFLKVTERPNIDDVVPQLGSHYLLKYI